MTSTLSMPVGRLVPGSEAVLVDLLQSKRSSRCRSVAPRDIPRACRCTTPRLTLDLVVAMQSQDPQNQLRVAPDLLGDHVQSGVAREVDVLQRGGHVRERRRAHASEVVLGE